MHEFYLPQLLPPPQDVPIARRPFDPSWATHSLGPLDVECLSCKALHWVDERLSKSSKTNPKFGMCCFQGKIALPALESLPTELKDFYNKRDPISKAFCEKIRKYNNAFAFTSVGRKMDYTVNNGGGPWVFKMHGELMHKIGSLLPAEGPDADPPSYAQLYLYDPQTALEKRMGISWNSGLDINIMRTLQDVLYRHHPGVELYQHAKELMANIPEGDDCELSIHFDTASDRRRYNEPDPANNEISIMIPDDGYQVKDSQDIIIHLRDGPVQRMSDCHPFYPALRYVLLFPTGQLGWHPKIPYQEIENAIQPNEDEDNDENNENQRCVSMAQFYKYQLHIRTVGSNHLFLAGSLFQEYVCEAWAMAEQNRLNYIKLNQRDLRVELYKGLQDAATRDDSDWDELGKRFILPSSFTGSTRNMQQHLQDALAINRYYGGGDLFITMTANSYWPEIKAALLHGQHSSERHDLVVRVFFVKLKALMKEIRSGALGAWAGHIYTIEFQKRGLPHAHIIVFLKPEAKLRTPEQIDSLMSSEFPEDNPALLELIEKYMVHRPCGAQNPNASCMVNGACSKGFPKPFREQTTISENSYACTRRSNTGVTHTVDHKQVDNQWVVCYSPYLTWKYRCHINVESIASVKAIKYIYKYVYKGHDRASMQFGRSVDEVKLYLDARYISSCEAMWRLFLFHMQKQVPNVVRLQVHLPEEQSVIFDPQNPDPNPREKPTTLMGWFNANAAAPEGSVILNTLYQDFPSKMVWNAKQHIWTQRKDERFAIGRMYYAHPSAEERFYLRLLLTCVKGAISFKHLRTFEGTEHATFREACIARGLLEDDSEWHQCLEEAKDMQMGGQLRRLFVTILCDCFPTHPRALWDDFKSYLCDDLASYLRRETDIHEPTEEQIYDCGLYLIDKLLSVFGKGLRNWPSLPLPDPDFDWAAILNHLIGEQRYDPDVQKDQAEENIPKLNADQKTAFVEIYTAVEQRNGKIFFLHGSGGTGKTFLYNTLCYKLRSEEKIVLCVASSGIAALLLKGGTTAHSRFKIPIPCHEDSVCNIPKNSDLAELMRKTDLVIWDEAPMQHKYNMEAVDRSLRDILNESDKPFGGLTFVFGGDFKQILPVIIKGGKAQTMGASIRRSMLWGHLIVLHLHQNMRLDTGIEAEANFAKWQLEAGQGKHTDNDSIISLPEHFKCRENTAASLIESIYPGIRTGNHAPLYFAERTILSGLNSEVDSMNKELLRQFPGQGRMFHSADCIPSTEQTGEDDPMLNYPPEYLNEINCSGLPLAKLELKVGCPIMVLRNLDAANGVCNGSRGMLTRWSNRVLEVELITGDFIGKKIFIPRISNVPTDEQVAFKFTRRQFPVRLCFAMTINKSQGQTVKYVGLDLRRPVFTHGQFYVGVSRVTSVSNIKVIWEESVEEAKTKNIVYSEILV